MRSSLATGQRSFLARSRAKEIRELVFRVGKRKSVKINIHSYVLGLRLTRTRR